MYTVSRALEEFFGQCEPDRGEFTFTVLHFPVSISIIIVVFISIFNFLLETSSVITGLAFRTSH